MLNNFYTTYINNILIYNNSKKKYQAHMQKILTALEKVGLQGDINKCKFHITKISYLGLIISIEDI